MLKNVGRKDTFYEYYQQKKSNGNKAGVSHIFIISVHTHTHTKYEKFNGKTWKDQK